MKRKPFGLTLVELMVAMAVAGIMLAVAVPQLSRFMQDQAVDSQARLLAADLRQARSEALRRNATVVLCARADGDTPACADDTDWKKGWVMYADTNADGALGDGELIKAQEALQSVGTAGGTATGGATTVQFVPTGIANDGFTFSLASASTGGTGRCIDLKRSGNVSVSQGACP